MGADQTWIGPLNNGAYLAHRMWEGAVDVANNRTTVNWTTTIYRGSNTASYEFTPITTAFFFGGNNYSSSYTFDFRSATSVLIGNGGGWVNHKADGTQQIDGWGNTAYTRTAVGGPVTAGGTLVMTPISRASVPTVSPNPMVAGSPVTITTNRSSGSYTHTLKYVFGTQSGTIATGVGASTSWTPPLSLLTEIPNTTSGTITLITDTFNGATPVGSITRTFTLNVPSSVVPSISSISNSEANSTVATQVGAYVQSLSRINLAIVGAAGAYGSTITAYKITLAGQTINAASGTTEVINSPGTLPVVATVTDSRNRTYSTSINVSLLDYAVPVIDAPVFKVSRSNASGVIDENGDRIRVDLKAAVSSLIVGTQKNQLTFRVYTREKGTTTWALKYTSSLGTGTTGYNSYVVVATYAIEKSWDVRVEVADKFAQAAIIGVVATAGIFMHWGTGVGVGKFWEQGGVDVAGDIFQGGQVVIDASDVATATAKGIVELATDAEAITGTDTTRALTPANLSARTATDSRTGVVELATNAETSTGTDATRAVTPAGLKSEMDSHGIFAKMAAGTVSTSASGNVTITFPVGRFSTAPLVFLMPWNHPNVITPRIGATATTTSVAVAAYAGGTTLVVLTMNWLAIQP